MYIIYLLDQSNNLIFLILKNILYRYMYIYIYIYMYIYIYISYIYLLYFTLFYIGTIIMAQMPQHISI